MHRPTGGGAVLTDDVLDMEAADVTATGGRLRRRSGADQQRERRSTEAEGRTDGSGWDLTLLGTSTDGEYRWRHVPAGSRALDAGSWNDAV
jgi:hypothetical protein